MIDQSRARAFWWIAVLGLFFVSSLALVLGDFNYSNPATAASDHLQHHLPGVIAYSGETPVAAHAYSPNIPGYYVFFGAVRRWITHSVVGLRLANLLVTTGLALTLAAAVGGECPYTLAAFLVAPFLFSESVFTRGIWLGTDNPAWWGVLVVLMMALRRRTDAFTTVAAGTICLATAAVRQNHIWIVPFLVFAALIGPGDEPRIGGPGLRRALGMAAAMMPVVLMTAWFVVRWHGLVEPGFGRSHEGFSLAAIPMTFALLAIFGAFYASAIRRDLYEKLKADPPASTRYVLGGLLLGGAAGICAETSYVPWYRGYGIWLIAKVTPMVFGRSIVIALLAAGGGVIASLFFAMLTKRDRWVFGAAGVCFMVVQCAHPAEFERYYEPFVLMLLALATSRIAGRRPAPTERLFSAAGLVMLTVIQAAYTAWRLSIPA